MKYIYPVTALLLCLFSSCGKSNDAPEMIKRLPVDCVFKTVILPVKLSETTGLDAYKEKVYIVNSVDEFPDNEIIPCDDLEAVDVDFTRQSMIISYQLQLGKIVSAEYRWLYNDWDDHYTLDTTFKKSKTQNTKTALSKTSHTYAAPFSSPAYPLTHASPGHTK